MKYVVNYLSHLSSQCDIKNILLFSVDDKAKVKIGIPAVSKFVKSQKFFEVGKGPKTPDHDFPVGERLLIIPSGNLILIILNHFNRLS